MAVIQEAYLAKLRQHAADQIAGAKAVIGNTTADISTIEKDVLEDGYVRIRVTIPYSVVGDGTISRIYLVDEDGNNCVIHDVRITRATSMDSILYEIKFQILADE